MNDRTLTIDHLVLTGLGVTPDRAERIRVLVEMELQRALVQGDVLDGLSSGEMRRLATPPIQIASAHDEVHLAGSLARSLAHTLQDTD